MKEHFILVREDREDNDYDIFGVYESHELAEGAILLWMFDISSGGFESPIGEIYTSEDEDAEIYPTDKAIWKIVRREMNTPLY